MRIETFPFTLIGWSFMMSPFFSHSVVDGMKDCGSLGLSVNAATFRSGLQGRVDINDRSWGRGVEHDERTQVDQTGAAGGLKDQFGAVNERAHDRIE